MFVPRALRLKGVKSRASAVAPKKLPPTSKSVDREIDATVDIQKPSDPVTNTTHTTTLTDNSASAAPQSTNKSITPAYLSQLLTGIELIFTDYAHQDAEDKIWLEKHYRTLGSEEKFIHLSALLDNRNVAMLKPTVTQPLIQRALQADPPSATLELSEDGHFVRRRPSTYPLHFIPKDASSIVDDEGLGFWDARTIYVEPHTRDLCKFPAKVAWWLNNHGQMREKWLPIQAVKTLYNSCAFVVLSGNVTHEKMWQKWRDKAVPENWKIMSKVEHTERTNEYLELLRKDNPRMIARTNSKASNGEAKHDVTKRTTVSNTNKDSSIPVRVKEKTVEERGEPKVSSTVDKEDSAAAPLSIGNKRKRKRRKKGSKSTDQPDLTGTNELDRIGQDASESDSDDAESQPTMKQAKLSRRGDSATSQNKPSVILEDEIKSEQRKGTAFKGSKITFDD